MKAGLTLASESVAPARFPHGKTLRWNESTHFLEPIGGFNISKLKRSIASGRLRDGEALELIVRVADTYFTILERQDGLNAAMAGQNAVRHRSKSNNGLM